MFKLFKKKSSPNRPEKLPNSSTDRALMPIELAYKNEEEKSILYPLYESGDYGSLKFRYIDLYEEAFDREDFRDAYIYRKNYIACVLMDYLVQIKDLSMDYHDFQVKAYSNDSDKEKKCKSPECVVYDFKDFYSNPTRPCCEDCPCWRHYHCDIIIGPK